MLLDAKFILTFSFLLYPLLGLFLGYLTRNIPVVRRAILIPVFMIGMIAIIASIFGISTIYTQLNFILYSSLYLSVSLGLWYIFFKKSKIIAAILMFTLYGLGYAFSLFLPLTGDILPKITERLADDIIYKETFIPSEYAGKQIEVFRVYNIFLQKRILSKKYIDTAPAFVTNALDTQYDIDKKCIYLAISADSTRYIYTFHKNFDRNWRDTLHLK